MAFAAGRFLVTNCAADDDTHARSLSLEWLQSRAGIPMPARLVGAFSHRQGKAQVTGLQAMGTCSRVGYRWPFAPRDDDDFQAADSRQARVEVPNSLDSKAASTS